MSTELRWIVSHSASCLHIADVVRRGHDLADKTLQEAIRGPMAEFETAIDGAVVSRPQFWDVLFPLAVRIESNNELARAVVGKLVGQCDRTPWAISHIESAIQSLELAVLEHRPEIVDELAEEGLRLRDPWEFQATNLLGRIGELTDPMLIAASADVALVHPALGGYGRAHLHGNCVRIEPVARPDAAEDPNAANSTDRLEAMRLAWLLSQLNIDLPIISEAIDADRLPTLAALTMLPPTCVAAAEQDLFTDDIEAIATVLDAWDIAGEFSLPRDFDLLDALMRWWDTWVDCRPPVQIALAALDRILDDVEMTTPGHAGTPLA